MHIPFTKLLKELLFVVFGVSPTHVENVGMFGSRNNVFHKILSSVECVATGKVIFRTSKDFDLEVM